MNIFEKAISKLESLKDNDKAAMTPNAVIGLAISVLIVAAVLPDAISALFNVSTVGWSTGTVAIWNVLPLIIIAAIALSYYSVKKGQ